MKMVINLNIRIKKYLKNKERLLRFFESIFWKIPFRKYYIILRQDQNRREFENIGIFGKKK